MKWVYGLSKLRELIFGIDYHKKFKKYLKELNREGSDYKLSEMEIRTKDPLISMLKRLDFQGPSQEEGD